MKYTVTIILVLLYCFAQFSPPVSAAISEKHPSPNIRSQDCYDNDIGYLRHGEKKPVPVPGQCELAVCNYGRVWFKGCTRFWPIPNGCSEIDGDPWQLYPYCCPKLYCPPWIRSQKTIPIPKSPIV